MSMHVGRIADREVREAWWQRLDPDIFAVQRDEDATREAAEIDRLIEDVERELAETEHAVLVRLTHDFTDQRRAFRASRRAGRGVLRSLPQVVPAEALLRAAVGGDPA
jgi:hypothetical protein